MNDARTLNDRSASEGYTMMRKCDSLIAALATGTFLLVLTTGIAQAENTAHTPRLILQITV